MRPASTIRCSKRTSPRSWSKCSMAIASRRDCQIISVELTVPLGVPEIIREGTDVTVVTYGACCRIALDAADKLKASGIEAEIVDVQSLLPFDIHGTIVESLRKRIASCSWMRTCPAERLPICWRKSSKNKAATITSTPSRTLSGTDHRPAYGSDGDYWSKPNAETVFDAVYGLMHEALPARYPAIK